MLAPRCRSSRRTTPSFGYDPASAKGLELIQASSLKLTDPELSAYGAHGFVITERQHFPTFAYGYETIYSADLPLYVSADSILEAVHRSYDTLLESIENGVLIPELRSMLKGMRASLLGAPIDQGSADADVYLAVALSLLDGAEVEPVLGGDPSSIHELFGLAVRHEGTKDVRLFGVLRLNEDFSQFTPRGHYTDTKELSQYFQSMMWLGRLDLRFIEIQSNGQTIFRRRQVEAAMRLRDLLGPGPRASWSKIDATSEVFVGKADYMTLPQLDSLLHDVGVATTAELAKVADQTIAEAIVNGGYGTQKISSHIVIDGLGTQTLPLDSSFALLG